MLQAGVSPTTHMVGGYGHLHYRMASYSQNHFTKAHTVEIEKVEEVGDGCDPAR